MTSAMFYQAVSERNFEKLRELIDNEFKIDKKMKNRLRECLQKSGCNEKQIALFISKHLKPGTLEVFNSESWKFQSISALSKFPSKPIALFNVSAMDYRPGVAEYGAVRKYYLNTSFSFQKAASRGVFYLTLSKRFTVIRVVVDDKMQLPSIIDLAKQIFPHLPILAWILVGHGNKHAIAIGKNNLESTDSKIMESVSKKLDPRATLILGGCSTASDTPSADSCTPSSNITKTFSQHSQKRIVMGAPNAFSELLPVCISNNPQILLSFFTLPNKQKPQNQCRAYIDGEIVLDGSQAATYRSRL